MKHPIMFLLALFGALSSAWNLAHGDRMALIPFIICAWGTWALAAKDEEK